MGFLESFALAFALAGHGCSAAGIPDTYDSEFRAAVHVYWPAEIQFDWCELKARTQVESHFRNDAVSPVGATCLLQVMPGTAMDFGVSVTELMDSTVCINTAARVSARYWNFWKTPRPFDVQRNLERASYNAGPGHLLSAQVLCGGALTWYNGIRDCLEQVTGTHSVETLGYVDKIRDAKERLQSD